MLKARLLNDLLNDVLGTTSDAVKDVKATVQDVVQDTGKVIQVSKAEKSSKAQATSSVAKPQETQQKGLLGGVVDLVDDAVDNVAKVVDDTLDNVQTLVSHVLKPATTKSPSKTNASKPTTTSKGLIGGIGDGLETIISHIVDPITKPLLPSITIGNPVGPTKKPGGGGNSITIGLPTTRKSGGGGILDPITSVIGEITSAIIDRPDPPKTTKDPVETTRKRPQTTTAPRSKPTSRDENPGQEEKPSKTTVQHTDPTRSGQGQPERPATTQGLPTQTQRVPTEENSPRESTTREKPTRTSLDEPETFPTFDAETSSTFAVDFSTTGPIASSEPASTTRLAFQSGSSRGPARLGAEVSAPFASFTADLLSSLSLEQLPPGISINTGSETQTQTASDGRVFTIAPVPTNPGGGDGGGSDSSASKAGRTAAAWVGAIIAALIAAAIVYWLVSMKRRHKRDRARGIRFSASTEDAMPQDVPATVVVQTPNAPATGFNSNPFLTANEQARNIQTATTDRTQSSYNDITSDEMFFKPAQPASLIDHPYSSDRNSTFTTVSRQSNDPFRRVLPPQDANNPFVFDPFVQSPTSPADLINLGEAITTRSMDADSSSEEELFHSAPQSGRESAASNYTIATDTDSTFTVALVAAMRPNIVVSEDPNPFLSEEEKRTSDFTIRSISH